jgi:hypothetical protein
MPQAKQQNKATKQGNKRNRDGLKTGRLRR